MVAYKDVSLCCPSMTEYEGILLKLSHQIALIHSELSLLKSIIIPVGYPLYKLSNKFLTRALSQTYPLCKFGNQIKLVFIPSTNDEIGRDVCLKIGITQL